MASAAHGQTVRVQVGTSDLFPATGGEVSLFSGDSSVSFGAGTLNDHFVFGANAGYRLGDFDLIAGDQTLPFVLDSDFTESGYGYAGRGLRIRFAGEWLHENGAYIPNFYNREVLPILEHCSVFVGGSATSYVVPFFRSAQFSTPLGYLDCRDLLSKRWSFSSHDAFGPRQTAIQTLAYRLDGLTLAASAGIGSNSPYGAILAKYEDRRHLLVKGTYVYSNDSFRRILVQAPLISENTRFNGQILYSPWKGITLSASRNHLTAPEINLPSVSATVTTFGGFFRRGIFDGRASDFRSSAYGFSTEGQDFGGGLRLGQDRFSIHEDYLRSRSENFKFQTAITSLSERVRRFTFVENYVRSTSGGETTNSFDAGISFRSNPLTLSLQMEEEFFPFALPGHNPFSRVLSLQLQGSVKDASISGMTYFTPEGHMRFMAWAEDFFYGSHSLGLGEARHVRAVSSLGKYIVRFRVTDPTGAPVFGMAIRVNGDGVIFSNRDGSAFIRLKKQEQNIPVEVEPAQAIEGRWQVVSAPQAVDAQPDSDAVPTQIIVRRIP